LASMRYYRSLLKAEEQKAYDALEKGLLAVKDRFLLPRDAFRHVQMALIALQMDQGELFYVDFGALRFEQNRFMTVCTAAYDDTPANIQARREKIARLAGQIIAPVLSAGELQKELAVHDYLVKHVVTGAPHGDGRASSIEGALTDGAAWGAGYARAFAYLMELAGVPAMIVTGRCKDQPDAQHVWNIVQLAGRHHQVDVMNDRLFCGCPTRTYVNMSDKRAALQLEPHLIYPLPACPTGASPIPHARTPQELLDVLRAAAASGRKFVQVSAAHRFRDISEIEDLLRRKMSQQDIVWFNRLDQVLYEPVPGVMSFTLK